MVYGPAVEATARGRVKVESWLGLRRERREVGGGDNWPVMEMGDWPRRNCSINSTAVKGDSDRLLRDSTELRIGM